MPQTPYFFGITMVTRFELMTSSKSPYQPDPSGFPGSLFEIKMIKITRILVCKLRTKSSKNITSIQCYTKMQSEEGLNHPHIFQSMLAFPRKELNCYFTIQFTEQHHFQIFSPRIHPADPSLGYQIYSNHPMAIIVCIEEYV